MPMFADVQDISKDLEEVYNEIGASALYIIITKNNIIDDIYLYNAQGTEEEFKVTGKVTINTPNKEINTSIGNQKDRVNYKVQILKSSLDSHNIKTITTKDKIKYNDTILEIASVKPSIVLGDYFVQYDLECYGEPVKLYGE